MLRRCMGCMEKYDDEFELCPHCGYIAGAISDEAYYIPTGTVLVGRYVIGKVLGFGGFGVTYLGWDKLLEKKIAIKEYLPSEFATRMPGTQDVSVFDGEKSEQFYIGKEKFVDEAKKLALFYKDAGIITVYEEFEDNGTAYLVMEYFEGETVSQLIKREGKLSPERVVEIILPILTSLQKVHEKGIIHRDIAPDNIYITKDNQVKLLDFGAARYATSTYSKSLSVILKPGYAPEEQYRSRGKQGPWSDVYAIAATMYYMLTGIIPQEAMERLGNDQLKPPKKLVDLPSNLNNAIMNALVVDAEQRTQSVSEFKDEITTEKETLLKKVKGRKREIGAIPRWAKISAIATTVTILILVVCMATGIIDTSIFLGGGNQMELLDNETYIPGLLNEDVADAEELAADAEVHIQILDKVINEKVDINKVMTQAPEAGMITIKGGVVNVVVSKGKQQVIVPDVLYMKKNTAKQELEKLGFKVKFKKADFNDVYAGCVGKQSVKESEEFSAGGVITLTIANKNKQEEDGNFKVTNLKGKKINDAIREVRKKGVYLVVKERVNSDEYKKGTIISQSVKKGAKVKKGSVIEVTVSKGEKRVQVPDVQYKDKDEAIKLLEEAGFKVKIKEKESTTVAKGRVISQSVEANELVKVGKEIILEISTGSKIIDEAIDKTEKYKDTVGSGVTDKVDIPSSDSGNKDEPIVHEWSQWTTDDSLINNAGYYAESKTQYSSRSRTSSVEYKTGPSVPAGTDWEKYDSQTTYSDWYAWTGWSRNVAYGSDTRQVESRVITDRPARSVYYSWVWPNGNCTTTQQGANQTYVEVDTLNYNVIPAKNSLGQDGYYAKSKATGQTFTMNGLITDFRFSRNEPEQTHTEWRYRDRTKTIINYYRRTVYSSWSSWGYWQDNRITGASTLKEIRTRTVYRYKKK